MSSSPKNVVSNRKKNDKKDDPVDQQPTQDKEIADKAPQPPAQSKLYTFIIRFITGLIMIVGFLILLNTNHVAITCFVILLQIIVFREIIALRYKEAKEKNLIGFRTLNWLVMDSFK